MRGLEVAHQDQTDESPSMHEMEGLRLVRLPLSSGHPVVRCDDPAPRLGTVRSLDRPSPRHHESRPVPTDCSAVRLATRCLPPARTGRPVPRLVRRFRVMGRRLLGGPRLGTRLRSGEDPPDFAVSRVLRCPGVSLGPVPVPGDVGIVLVLDHQGSQGVSGTFLQEFSRSTRRPQLLHSRWTFVPGIRAAVHRVIHGSVHTRGIRCPPCGQATACPTVLSRHRQCRTHPCRRAVITPA